jgi:hypothetical protein
LKGRGYKNAPQEVRGKVRLRFTTVAVDTSKAIRRVLGIAVPQSQVQVVLGLTASEGSGFGSCSDFFASFVTRVSLNFDLNELGESIPYSNEICNKWVKFGTILV